MFWRAGSASVYCQDWKKACDCSKSCCSCIRSSRRSASFLDFSTWDTLSRISAEIRDKVSQVEKSKNDADLRELRMQEQQLLEQSQAFFQSWQYTEAEPALQNILALPSGGVHRTDAQ